MKSFYAYKIGSIAIILIMCIGSPLSAQVLPLEQYLKQVNRDNKTIKTYASAIESYQKKISEKELLTTPYFNAKATGQYERKMGSFSGFLGATSYSAASQVGLSWQDDSGLEINTGYSLNYYKYPDASSLVSTKEYGEATPYIQASMPLLKNANGVLTRSQKQLIVAQYDIQTKSAEYAIKTYLIAAEIAYWRLSLAKQSVEIAKEAVDRAERMVSWSSTRQALALGDRSDLLQSQALLKLRHLELKQAKDSVSDAERLFNTYRGRSQQTVTESIELITDSKVDPIKPVSGYRLRKDVEIALASVQSANTQRLISDSEYDPNLTLLAKAQLNQVDGSVGNAIANTLSTDYPTIYFGVTYSMPLNSTLTTQLKSANLATVTNAEDKYQQTVFDARQEWTTLQQRLLDAKQKLALTRELESIQREKWRNEVSRHQRGRTTMAQVLQFEEDYAKAQTALLQIKAEILILSAQQVLYGS